MNKESFELNIQPYYYQFVHYFRDKVWKFRHCAQFSSTFQPGEHDCYVWRQNKVVQTNMIRKRQTSVSDTDLNISFIINLITRISLQIRTTQPYIHNNQFK